MIFLTEENKNEDPKLQCLDPRDIMNSLKLTVKCPRCEYLNNGNAINCYSCGWQLAKRLPSFKYKIGKHQYLPAEHRFAVEMGEKHRDLMLQPERYNKETKQFELNPEFVEKYGNPFEEKVEFGKGVEEELEWEGEEPETPEFDLETQEGVH